MQGYLGKQDLSSHMENSRVKAKMRVLKIVFVYVLEIMDKKKVGHLNLRLTRTPYSN